MFECIKKWFAKKETVPVEKPIEVVPEPTIPKLPIDLETFRRRLALGFAQYKEHQWEGFEIITRKFFELRYEDLRHLAYCLATAVHETAFTMRPVTEYGGEAYLRAKSYWPFVGRGYVQLTWEENYKKYNIASNPERALEPDFAAYVLIDGMERGVFTGAKLGQYFNWTANDPVNARRIVNGLDKASEIAAYHTQILACLSLSAASLNDHDLPSKLNQADLA